MQNNRHASWLSNMFHQQKLLCVKIIFPMPYKNGVFGPHRKKPSSCEPNLPWVAWQRLALVWSITIFLPHYHYHHCPAHTGAATMPCGAATVQPTTVYKFTWGSVHCFDARLVKGSSLIFSLRLRLLNWSTHCNKCAGKSVHWHSFTVMYTAEGWSDTNVKRQKPLCRRAAVPGVSSPCQWIRAVSTVVILSPHSPITKK